MVGEALFLRKAPSVFVQFLRQLQTAVPRKGPRLSCLVLLEGSGVNSKVLQQARKRAESMGPTKVHGRHLAAEAVPPH